MKRVLIGAILLLASPAWGQPVYRELLPNGGDWYVDQLNGNDANDCTAATPCKTIQPTLDKLTAKYDFGGTPTVHLLATNGYPTYYREAVNLYRWVGTPRLPYFVITGDPNDNAAVVVAPQNANVFSTSHTVGSPWLIKNLTTQCSPGYVGYLADAEGHIVLQNPNFGGCGWAHIQINHKSFGEILLGNVTISGSAQRFVVNQIVSEFTVQPITFTFLNNPTISCFASGAYNAFTWLADIGASTGARYIPCKVDPVGGGNVAGPSSGIWP